MESISAATRVFDTAELLELIFLQVHRIDLAKLQLVSKYARDLIKSSTKIQCKLCLLPVKGVHVTGYNPHRAFRIGKECCYLRMEMFDTFERSHASYGELHVTKTTRAAKDVFSINPDSEILGAVCHPTRYLLLKIHLYGDKHNRLPNTITQLKFPKATKLAEVLTSAKELHDGKEPSKKGVKMEWVKQEARNGWEEVYAWDVFDSRRK